MGDSPEKKTIRFSTSVSLLFDDIENLYSPYNGSIIHIRKNV